MNGNFESHWSITAILNIINEKQSWNKWIHVVTTPIITYIFLGILT